MMYKKLPVTLLPAAQNFEVTMVRPALSVNHVNHFCLSFSERKNAEVSLHPNSLRRIQPVRSYPSPSVTFPRSLIRRSTRLYAGFVSGVRFFLGHVTWEYRLRNQAASFYLLPTGIRYSGSSLAVICTIFLLFRHQKPR